MGHQPRERYLAQDELPWWWPPAWANEHTAWLKAAEEVAELSGASLPDEPLKRYKRCPQNGGMRDYFVEVPLPPRGGTGVRPPPRLPGFIYE